MGLPFHGARVPLTRDGLGVPSHHTGKGSSQGDLMTVTSLVAVARECRTLCRKGNVGLVGDCSIGRISSFGVTCSDLSQHVRRHDFHHHNQLHRDTADINALLRYLFECRNGAKGTPCTSENYISECGWAVMRCTPRCLSRGCEAIGVRQLTYTRLRRGNKQ